MARDTVDFGIDLGTTNSAIAVARGVDAEVVRNNLQRDFTPSAVHVNAAGRMYVGDRAKERLVSDPADTCGEFKLQMGVPGTHKTFTSAGREMTPEELSAEVLKSLRADVQRQLDEPVDAAVITVPAAFELDQCDATSRAASLAGLGHAPLLQEPTAAAWAYSVHDAPTRAFWLVYDLGGGTFDAAVLKIEDGEFTVVDHAGDNLLGGKLIDWALVEDVLVPAARKAHALASLSRDDGRQRANVAKLKAAAETAKIELSQADAVDVEADLVDDHGDQVRFELELTRARLERVAMPLYLRSIALCRKALADHGMATGDVERVLLVGGSTLSPTLRELIADPADGLGIRVDHRLDPITVVARGAAIFASTQRLPRSVRRQPAAEPGQLVLEFEHEPTGPDADPLIGGRVVATDGREWGGWTARLVVPDHYDSGQLALAGDGAFVTRVRVPENAASTVTVEVRDPHGTVVPTAPSATTYQHRSLVGGAATLSHSVGVGLSDNRVRQVLEKGAELPAEKSVRLRTTVEVRRGGRTGLIRVPVVEGERPAADRNTLVGVLDLTPDEVRRDVPAHSEVEVHVRVDASRLVHADAYVPVLDEEFQIRVELSRDEAPPVDELRAERQALLDRFEQLRERTVGADAPEAAYLLRQFEAADHLAGVDRELGRAAFAPDATSGAVVRLREAQAALDEVEDALELPTLVAEVRAERDEIAHLVRTYGRRTDRAELESADQALESAIAAGDRALIDRYRMALAEIALRTLKASDQYYPALFAACEAELAGSPDRNVRRALDQGRAALARGDSAGLAAVVDRLQPLLGDDGPGAVPGLGSTVTDGGGR